MADNPRIDDLRRRLDKEPGSRLFAQLAEELRKDGEFAEAVQVARSGLALHPNYPSARMTLGRALFDSGDMTAARGEFEAVLRGAPDNILASRFLAECLEALGDLGSALLQYRAAVRLAPGDRQMETHIRSLEQKLTPPRRAPADAAPPRGPGAVVPPTPGGRPAIATVRVEADTATVILRAAPPPLPGPARNLTQIMPEAPPPRAKSQPAEALGRPPSSPSAPGPLLPPSREAGGIVIEESFELEAPLGSRLHAPEPPPRRTLDFDPADDLENAPTLPPGAARAFADGAEGSDGTRPIPLVRTRAEPPPPSLPPAPPPPAVPPPAAASPPERAEEPGDWEIDTGPPAVIRLELLSDLPPPPGPVSPALPVPSASAVAPPASSAVGTPTESPSTPPSAPPVSPPVVASPPPDAFVAPPPPALPPSLRPSAFASPPTAEPAVLPPVASAAAPAARPAAPEPEPLVSSTLAELYVSQGFLDKAVEVYQQLIQREPENQRARTRLLELVAQSTAKPGETAARGVAMSGPPGDERRERRRAIERTIGRLEAFLAVVTGMKRERRT